MRSGRQPVVLLLVLAFLTAACTRPGGDWQAGDGQPSPPAAAPATPAGPAPAAPFSTPKTPDPAPPATATATPPAHQTPPAEKAPEGCTGGPQSGHSYGSIYFPFVSTSVRTGLCETKVHSDRIHIRFTLQAEVGAEALQRAVTVEGTDQQVGFRHGSYRGESWLDVTIPPGAEGERITVRLSGLKDRTGAAVEMGYRLHRVTTPRMITELRGPDGSWRPATPGATLPAGPLHLRFRLVGGIRTDDVVERLKQIFQGVRGARISVPAADLVEVRTEKAPARVLIDFGGNLTSLYGLPALRSDLVLYSGAAPRLVAIDPATGAEEVLGEAPPDVTGARVSPDGRFALLGAMLPGGDGWGGERVWAVHLEGRRITRTEMPWDSFVAPAQLWLPDRLVIEGYNRINSWDLRNWRGQAAPSAMERWAAVSPDRRWVVGFAYDWHREDRYFIAPADLVVHDLQSGWERVLPDAVHIAVPHSERPSHLRTRWLEEGALLVEDLISPAKEGVKIGSAWLRLNPETGALTPTDQIPPAADQSGQNRWIKGPGGWELLPQGWGDLTIRNQQGQTKSLGKGFPVGWRHDGALLAVRWENYPERRRRYFP